MTKEDELGQEGQAKEQRKGKEKKRVLSVTVTGSALLVLLARPHTFLCALHHLTLTQIKLAHPMVATLESKSYYHI